MLGHFTWNEGTKDVFFAGPTCTFQEPIFIPKEGGKEGEGYVMALLNHLDVLRNDILIFDSLDLAKGPVGAVHLPVKLRLGLHGNFVETRELDEWKERRREGGEVGPQKPATEPLPWQQKLGIGKNGVNGTNGTNGVEH